MLTMRDFCSVDHRLKLYLDMEVFDKSEEFRCFLKVRKTAHSTIHKVLYRMGPFFLTYHGLKQVVLLAFQ